MKTKTWLLILGGVLAVCAVLTALLLPDRGGGTAQVYSDGKLVCTLDLSQDTERTVRCEGGYNTLRVHDGKISVTDASCPDHTCMKAGAKSGGAPIICLPNRLEIRFCDSSVDAVAGG